MLIIVIHYLFQAIPVKRQSSPILVTERWAWSWLRCTGSQPAGDLKPSTQP